MGSDRVVDLGTADYADFELWKELMDTNVITKSVATAAVKAFDLPNGGSKSYYALVARNDVRAHAEAFVHGIALSAAGDVTVEAIEDASIASTDDSVVAAQSTARGGVIVTNQVQATADAFVRSSSVTTDTGGSGGLVVHAAVTAAIDATARPRRSRGDAIGVVIALNTVGWAADNILFALLDALLGSSYLTNERPVTASAYLLDSTVNVAGDLSVVAESAASIVADLGNEQVDVAANDFAIKAKWGATTKATGGALASNKVSSHAEARIDTTSSVRTITAGGTPTVSATDAASIESHAKIVVSAISTNTLNAVKGLLSALLPSTYQYTTASGTQTLSAGDRVRLGATYSHGGDGGAVYKYTGASGVSFDLGTTDYTPARGTRSPAATMTSPTSGPTSAT